MSAKLRSLTKEMSKLRALIRKLPTQNCLNKNIDISKISRISSSLKILQDTAEELLSERKNIPAGVIREIIFDIYGELLDKLNQTQLNNLNYLWLVRLAQSMTTEVYVVRFYSENSPKDQDANNSLQEIANISYGLGKLAQRRLLPFPTNNLSYSFLLELMQQFLRLLNKIASSQQQSTHNDENIFLSTRGLLICLRTFLQKKYLSESDYPAILIGINNLNLIVTFYGEHEEKIKKIQSGIINTLNIFYWSCNSFFISLMLHRNQQQVNQSPAASGAIITPRIINTSNIFHWSCNSFFFSLMKYRNQQQADQSPAANAPVTTQSRSAISSSTNFQQQTSIHQFRLQENLGAESSKIDSSAPVVNKPASYRINPYYGNNDENLFTPVKK